LAVARHFLAPEEGKIPAWGDSQEFEPRPGETIALIGGATVLAMQDHGFFETHLQRAFPDRGLKVRNIAWQADTVYRQQRPMFFYTTVGDTREGSVPDQRKKIEPGIMVLRFGKMESLDGLDAMADFATAYQRLLDGLSSFSERIVLVAPEPFFEVGPAADLAGERNGILERYVELIREIAEERGYRFIDLFHPLKREPAEEVSRTGIDLTSFGQERLGLLLAENLIEAELPKPNPERDEELRRLVLEKNQLWDQYYRPTNWAFLFGDRQHVPSSRDHRDTDRRWFVEELEKLPGLIAVTESEMSALRNRDR
jgi:hypothetical protein